MADKEDNLMVSWIAKYDAALADKEKLASIYNNAWRRSICPKLLKPGRVCYLGNAFGYQAPWFEECGLIRRGWQYRLEEGAKVLMPKLSNLDKGHLTKRMRDTESTSAEEELLLARGFAQEFREKAITVPRICSYKAQPEFEVNIDDHRILVEAKGRVMSKSVEQEREQRRKIDSILGIRIQSSPLLDDKIDEWIKNKIPNTLRRKSECGKGFVLVLSFYTLCSDFCANIDMIREFALNPGNPNYFLKKAGDLNLPDKHWALAMALVSGGSIQGVWFNPTVRERLRIDMTTQERIRTAIKNSFYPREDEVFFDEDMSDKEHKSALCKMLGHTKQ